MDVEKRILEPSGDQVGAPGRKVSVQTLRKLEPSRLTTKMPGGSGCAHRTNAMASPFGDHAGPRSSSGYGPVGVICRGALLPSAATVKSSVRPGTSVMRAE